MGQPDDPRPKALFERGVATVEALLPRYDTRWWSLYDLYHLEVAGPCNPCTAHYHDIHIKQLTIMHAITGREPFSAFARRWAAYQEGSRGRLRAYAEKAAFRRTVQAVLSGRELRTVRQRVEPAPSRCRTRLNLAQPFRE